MRILSDWLRRHRATVREVKATFVKLLELLAVSVGAEVWGNRKCTDVGS